MRRNPYRPSDSRTPVSNPAGVSRRRTTRRATPGVLTLEERQLLSVFDRADLLNVAQAAAPKGVAVDLYRLSDDLVDLYATEVRGMEPPAAVGGIAPTFVPLTRDADGRVAVRVTAADVPAITPLLADLGFVTTFAMPEYHLVEGYLPVNQLIDVTALSPNGLLGVTGVARPMTSTGSVLNEAEYTMQAARTRATNPPGVTGAGVTIGVLSDSYNNLGGAPSGVSSGDLPASLVFNRDLASGGTDEGRAMMELVHDLAPGSPKAFATAFGGEAVFAQNIRDLAKPVANGGAGAKVIVDDVFYFAEPMFQDGIITQAIDDVVTNSGVAYFSSAGNLADQAYENTSPAFLTTTIAAISATPAKYLQFAPGVVTQNITLSAQTFLAGLQWSDPFYTATGVKSNLDFFVLAGGSIITSSTSNNIATSVPNELVGIGGTGTVQLVIRLTAGVDPTRLKWVNFGANGSGPATIQFATNSPTITPHSASPNAMSVAASPMFDQRVVEGFSSKGPSTILFNPAGAPVAATVRAKPDIMATDGVSTTFFGQNLTGVGFLFFGTSAAAPNAAAVAALVRQANPSFTPAQVYNRLVSTADPNVTGGVNFVGAGLINAYKAVIGQPLVAGVNTTDGFETGVLGQTWDVFNSGSGRTNVTNLGAPAAGSRHLVLDSTVPGNIGGGDYSFPGLSEAILSVDLAGRTGVTVSYSAKRFSRESIGAIPASFTGHVNGDGVSFSVDGTNWFRLDALAGITTGYQTFSFDLSAAAATAGVTLGANTRIKFQRFESSSGQVGSPDGLAFDNVSVNATAKLTTTQIDDGTAQRSRIRSFTFNFAGNLATPVNAAAFTLRRTSDNLVIPLAIGAGTVIGGGTSTVILIPTGPNLQGGSLPDGNYTLTIDGSQLTDDAGNQVDAAGTGVRGSSRVLNFQRFFGDSNGDGVVDAADYLAFRTAYLGGNAATPAASIFDFDGDGSFTIADLVGFNENFRKRRL